MFADNRGSRKILCGRSAIGRLREGVRYYSRVAGGGDGRRWLRPAALVAQRIEHWSSEPGVGGSNPSGRAEIHGFEVLPELPW